MSSTFDYTLWRDVPEDVYAAAAKVRAFLSASQRPGNITMIDGLVIFDDLKKRGPNKQEILAANLVNAYLNETGAASLQGVKLA